MKGRFFRYSKYKAWIFFFQAEDGIRDKLVTGVQTCALPISLGRHDATLMVPSESGDDLLQRLRMVLAGEYEVEHELARGGMAVVFKATEVGLRRVVALKVLPPELGLTARAAERFKREARMVAEIDHPNIIPVYRVGQIGGILFFVMKFVEGKSLD